MSDKHLSYITLDSIINDYLIESEQSINKYYKLFHIAFRGMEQLGLDFFYQVKSVKLPINANKTVNLPPDILNYCKVGVLNNKGEVIILNYNSKLTTYADLSPNRLSKTKDDNLYGQFAPNDNVFFNYWYGGSYTNFYGLPSNEPVVGSFKIDLPNGIILLDETFKYEYIILEYLASPKEGEQYYVPMQFREALIAYMAWKDMNVATKFHAQLGEKRDRRHEFYNERRLAIARFKPFYIHDAYQTNLENTRMTVKN